MLQIQGKEGQEILFYSPAVEAIWAKEHPGEQSPNSLASSNDDNKVYRADEGVTLPSVISGSQVEGEYTDEARNAKISGVVKLAIVVGANGNLRTVKVIKSLGFGLDEAATEAVRKWKFKPGMKDGQPVAVVCSVEMEFREI